MAGQQSAMIVLGSVICILLAIFWGQKALGPSSDGTRVGHPPPAKGGKGSRDPAAKTPPARTPMKKPSPEAPTAPPKRPQAQKPAPPEGKPKPKPKPGSLEAQVAQLHDIRQAKTGRPTYSVAEELAPLGPNPTKAELVKHLLSLLVEPNNRHRKLLETSFGSGALEKRRVASENKFPRLRLKETSTESHKICWHTAFFRENSRGYMLATDENVNAFIEVCEGVYQALEAPVKRRLETLLRGGTLASKLTDGSFPDLPKADWKTCAAGLPRKTDKDLMKDGYHAHYQKLNFRPLKERYVEPSQIRDAMARAELVAFDARKVLPPEMFNVSIHDLDALHPEAAETIPIHYGSYHGFYAVCDFALANFADRFQSMAPELLQAVMRIALPFMLSQSNICLPTFSLHEMSRFTKGLVDEIPYDKFGDYGDAVIYDFAKLRAANKTISTHEINVRRLPKWNKVPNVPKKIGLEDITEHTHSFLWMGVTPGEFHTDGCDNIIMQIAGEADFMSFPANCSSLVEDMPRQESIDNWINLWKARGIDIPFYHTRLRPGDGIVVPSNAKHRVIVQQKKRIGYNVFFEPKFGMMQWPYAPSHEYKRADWDVLSVRALWMRTVAKLYDTRKISMYFRTVRQELI